ncbi:replication-relaxation family protein [Streptomyces mangrovi]|uniref:replication-relaxation family protein n=1 Tax=Streptomyces mangrovi TaxID=1206892 RepID=UPI00399CF0D6
MARAVKAEKLPYGSTDEMRQRVLAVLGVVKVATAAQLRQLVCPGTVDVQTARNACKDLAVLGLAESVGKATRAGKGGRKVREDLWNLTAAGLEAAAAMLDRPAREMGGTARNAAAAGAPHARKVTDVIDAFLQTPPEPTRPPVRRNAPARPARPLPVRPPGLGTIASWSTEVGLPVTGTFAHPGKGSPRADAVVVAPEMGLPVLFVEVDNGTQDPAIVAAKLDRYRAFFRRTTKTTGGREVPMWRLLYQPPQREGHPPVALVFTQQAAREETVLARMKTIRDLSRACWAGRRVFEGYTDYGDTVPVLAITLDRLRTHGPLGPVWWRYGHQPWQTLTDALADTDDEAACRAREEKRRAEDQARQERERREQEEARRRRETTAWPCPTCGRTTYPPDPAWDDSDQPTEPGDDCTVCARAKERERQDAEARAAAEVEAAAARRSPLRRLFG